MKFSTLTMAALMLAACTLPAFAGNKKLPQKTRSTHEVTGPLYATRTDVMQQADAMADALGLERDWVRQTLGAAHYLPGVAKAILPPAVGVAKNWTAYRARFVEPRRIQAGTRFWLANRDTLQRAEEQTGVPASIIVGILGVESQYGQNTGDYRVIDALCTLSFDFPAAHPRAQAREAFFHSELLAYLTLTSRTHTDPLALRGSYAGALGWPQFMPSSWVKYAIDFDGDDRVDLFNSQADIIGSVAHYFQAFHWQRGMATHYPLHFDPAALDLATLLVPDILPTFTVAELAAHGVLLDAPGKQHSGPLALIELQNGAYAPQYVAGTENFYAITRYNWSSYYAMAVIELGDAVAVAVAAKTGPPAQADVTK